MLECSREPLTFYGQTSLGVLAVASFRTKMGKKKIPTETPDHVWPFKGPFLSKDFLSKFPAFFFRAVFRISIFSFFFQRLKCEAFQIFCPLLNSQTMEIFPVFPAFPDFLGKKKYFDKNGP